MKLRGKVAIVTGGGRGIGRAIALRMAGEGASVAIISRTKVELAGTARAIGERCIYHVGDVSDPSDVKALVRKTVDAFGGIDILVNNAAIRGPVAPLYQVTPEEWQKTLAINLSGAFMFCRAVVPLLIERGKGKIINITSGLGEMVLPPLGAYSVSKAALNHLTRIMAEELRRYNIQVNALDPGVVDTSMQEGLRDLGPGVLGEELYGELMTLKQSGYIESPENVAELAAFLASAEADSITGEIGAKTDYIRMGFRPGG